MFKLSHLLPFLVVKFARKLSNKTNYWFSQSFKYQPEIFFVQPSNWRVTGVTGWLVSVYLLWGKINGWNFPPRKGGRRILPKVMKYLLSFWWLKTTNCGKSPCFVLLELVVILSLKYQRIIQAVEYKWCVGQVSLSHPPARHLFVQTSQTSSALRHRLGRSSK